MESYTKPAKPSSDDIAVSSAQRKTEIARKADQFERSHKKQSPGVLSPEECGLDI